jgi:hypothetical protein
MCRETSPMTLDEDLPPRLEGSLGSWINGEPLGVSCPGPLGYVNSGQPGPRKDSVSQSKWCCSWRRGDWRSAG